MPLLRRCWISSRLETYGARGAPYGKRGSVGCPVRTTQPEEIDEKQRYEAGMQVRRAVLGDAHVDRSLEKLT